MNKKNFSDIACPKGVFDIYPNSADKKTYWQDCTLWQHVENVIRNFAHRYSYEEIRTPIFEKKALFQRSVGEETDIVSKEMYTFHDKKDREFCLRPEGTASIIRAFIEEGLDRSSSTYRYFYIGPMFRYERQQKGRYRQHHQFGVEVFGSYSPLQDVECIEMLYSFYQNLGLKDLTIHINSLGNTDSRAKYREELIAYLTPHTTSLSPDSQKRFEVNPLRILDSKDKTDIQIIAHAPKISDCLTSESRDHFDSVIKGLENLKIPYKINANLVRGLDYYCDTVFEITADTSSAAQNSLGGGGRYNDLIEQLGGPSLPGIGFATGIERIIQTLIEQKADLPKRESTSLYLLPLDVDSQTFCLSLATELRHSGLSVGVSFASKKLKQMFSQMDNLSPDYVSVIGSDEINSQKCTVKDWKSRQETVYKFSELSDLGA